MKPNLFILLFASCATPALACNPTLFERVHVPLAGEPDSTFEVKEVQSSEGGEWKVWSRADGGAAEEVVRIDYGEMGRLETRMIIQSAAAYGVTQTRSFYAAPIYAEGASTVRIETDIYLFCDGELDTPPEDFGINPGYAASAEAALEVFESKEIAEFLPPGL